MPGDVSGEHALLALGVAAAAAWLVAAAILYLLRRPPEPPVGPRTLEVGPEPPAVASFLVHDFRVTDDAVPATLLDLAAREVVEIERREPGVHYVRVRPSQGDPLTAYERRVLEHLRQRAVDGVVPASAMTTGPREESSRWWRSFVREVVDDAKRLGLSRDRLDARVFTAFGIAAIVPAALAWAVAAAYQAGFVVLVVAIALLGWIRARHPQQATADGLLAASRWLGVRAELAANEVFATRTPLEVALWGRLLAYGAALGVASGAAGPLPMGVESDHHAWSAASGRWRHIRVRYPRVLPLGWGLTPRAAMVRGAVCVIVGAAFLYLFGPLVVDVVSGGWGVVVAGALLALPCAAVGVGVTLVAMAFADLGEPVEVTGQVLRLRVFGSEKKQSHYVALDDGTSSVIRAWRVEPQFYAGLAQGDVVTAAVTRTLRSVRSIVPARHDG
jgi:hypothetical protein